MGNTELTGGVPLIPALIGMFAMPEIIRFVLSDRTQLAVVQRRIGNIFAHQWEYLRRYRLNLLRGATLGTVIGALPGAGADIAAWIAYRSEERRVGKECVSTCRSRWS